jgi:hypothetical protein
MASVSTKTDFIIWDADQTASGPVELPELVSLVQEGRVTADTWIFGAKNASWCKAAQVPELQMFFRPIDPNEASIESVIGIEPRHLRRVKILAKFSDEQLIRFSKYLEFEKLRPWAMVFKQGDPGDAMYLVLQGELRVRIMSNDKETLLTRLGPGDFFGDISLFDQGPRSADVVANADSLVIKITTASFERLSKEAPDLATPFLCAIGKTLSARIRADNKRLDATVKFSRIF